MLRMGSEDPGSVVRHDEEEEGVDGPKEDGRKEEGAWLMVHVDG